MSSRLIALVLAGPLAATGSAPALAFGPEEEPPADGAADEAPAEEEIGGEPAVEEAKSLFNEGAGKFETADYAGAIELWTKAYSIVPNRPEYAPIKAKLIANLASAQERAYAVDAETSHLNQAKILLESYREVIDDIYTSTIEREKELAWVTERLQKIDDELQAVADREEAQRRKAEQDDRRLAPGQGLMISGGVLTGLGAAGLGLMVGGMVMGQGANDISDIPSNDFTAREARFDRGRTGNLLAIVGGAGGAVLIGTGVALLVVGLKKKKEAGGEEAAQARVVPNFGPDRVGVGLVGRF